MIQTCPKCQHTWDCKSSATWITCPGCQRKFKRPDRFIVDTMDVPLTAVCPICNETGPLRIARFNNNSVQLGCAACINK